VKKGPVQMGGLIRYARDAARMSGSNNPGDDEIDDFLQDCFMNYLEDESRFNRKVKHNISTFLENISQYAGAVLEDANER
jgi:DNA-directed RNA polymerase specialized sigma24 family protein